MVPFWGFNGMLFAGHVASKGRRRFKASYCSRFFSGHLDRPVKPAYVDIFRDATVDMLLGGRMLVSKDLCKVDG